MNEFIGVHSCDFCGLRYPAESYGVDWFDTTELHELIVATLRAPLMTSKEKKQKVGVFPFVATND